MNLVTKIWNTQSKGRRGNEVMKQGMKWGLKSLWLLMAVVGICILGWTSVAKADVAASDIKDGIDNWQEQGSTTVGYKKISSDLQVGYTFGSWSGGDTSTIQNMRDGSGLNVFLQNSDGSKVQTVYIDGDKGPTSSIDFGVFFQNDSVLSTSDSQLNAFMTTRKYYIGTDKNGNQASKLMGIWNLPDDYGVIHTFEVEILLRQSTSNSSSISRELYLKNTETTVQNYGIIFGEDTDLDNNDATPILALADNSGIYMSDSQYKLTINKNVADGPSSYTGQNYRSYPQWFSAFSPQNFSGTGAEVKNLNGGDLLTNLKDSSYTVKWPFKSIAPGATDHYASELGINEAGNSTASVQKTYTNQTSTDGKNRVGDNLSFKINATNNGYKSQWSSINFKDVLPKGLQIDPNSIKLTSPSGSQTIDASDYDASSRTLNIPTSVNLTDNQSASVTFNAKITGDASGTTVTNSGTVSGTDALATNKPTVSATGSVDVPVEENPYAATFTKQVKNKTAGDTDFQNDTTGTYGDTVSYQIKYGVNTASQNGLASGQLQDKLPDGLTLVPGSISLTANGTTSSPTDLSKITLPKLTAGQTATINFDAKVTGTTPATLTNNATVSGTTDGGNTVSGQSNDAVVNPANWVGFVSLPDQIDFGTHETKETNFTNQSTTRNGSTDKTLQVDNYSTAPDYQVNVAYDNDGDHKLTDAKGDAITPSDGQNLIFFKDIATGNWVAVTPTGTPLNSAGFSQTGLNDLTSAVGAGKWRMSNRTYQPKVGKYNGTFTWQVTNSL